MVFATGELTQMQSGSIEKMLYAGVAKTKKKIVEMCILMYAYDNYPSVYEKYKNGEFESDSKQYSDVEGLFRNEEC